MKQAIKHGWKLKSRFLALMLVISMVVSLLPVSLLPTQQVSAAESIRFQSASVTDGFRDVSPSDWFYDAVVYVQKNGIFTGTDTDIFSPEGTMTRAMYVTALGRMAGVNINEYSTTSFADVPAGVWYAPYVEWAVKKGIAVGTGNGSFSPNGLVSREQMATLNLRYFESYQIPYQTSNRVTTEPSDLAKISPWALEAVIKLWQAGLFVGGENGKFNPDAPASRAEAAVLFMRNNTVVEAWKTQNQSTPTPTVTATPTQTPAPTSGPGGGNNGGNSNDSEYTLTFESNGGTAVPDQRVKYGSQVILPEAPTKAGSTFGGWYSDIGLTIPYNFSTAVTANISLYAKWTTNSYTVSFDSNGGSEIAARTVEGGASLGRLPSPIKEGHIFQGWFSDSDLSFIFTEGSTVTADTRLYAKYIDHENHVVQSIPSYSLLDVAPDFTIAIVDHTGTLTASEVQERVTFENTANSESAGITITGSNGSFTASSAAEEGQFEEGHTYQLSLIDDKLSFQDQDESTSIFVFSVAKQEVMNIPLHPNMIYLSFAEVSDMMLGGNDMSSPAIPVVTTTIGDIGANLAEANAGGGTFVYTGSTAISVGDTVAIYEGIRPDLRTVATTGEDDGDIAYVQITEIEGSNYAYHRAEVNQVLFKPDILPVSVDADTDGNPFNNSITIEHTVMNYSDSLFEPLGLNELTTVDVGDFIVFYEGNITEEDVAIVRYGRITSITPVAEMDVITYIEVTSDDIEHVFDLYKEQAIDGEMLLSEEDIERLENQIVQQAAASGFVDQAVDYLSALAMETDTYKSQMKVSMLSSSSGVGEVSVENLTVVASLGTTLRNIAGQNSGVSATLQIGADIVIRIHEDSDLVIHMTGTFLEEISLNLGVNGKTEWKKACVWLLCVPYPGDFLVTANLDAYTYTGINITAQMATVEHDKLQDALDDWDKEANSGRLGMVRDITTEIQAIIDGVQETSVDTSALMEQYQEMMENESQWVPLIKQELIDKSLRVALGVVEINFTAEFVVSAKVNLTLGVDFNYTTAKRYSATLHVLGFRGSSSTVSLPGDGNYQFTFYVMGTLGLRAGILMELKAGVGSVKLNSIGLSVEPGAYINLWGYFYYQLKRVDGVESTKSLGALLVEMGIYLESAIGAQFGDGLVSGSVPVYENIWPLYTVGEQHNVYDFAYSQEEAPLLKMAGSAISTTLPDMLFTMSTFDLKTGDIDTQLYDRSKFDIQVDHPNFMYLLNTGKVEVFNKNLSLSEGNLVITWKGAPLSFTSEPITRKIPLQWLSRSGDYVLQLSPNNGKATEIISAPYNAEISAATPEYVGYTFAGWNVDYGDGTSIPSRMPARDLSAYASWTANSNTPYTVQHYLVDPNTRTAASPAVTEHLTGTTDTEIVIASDRFLDQGYRTGTTSGKYIKGDGSTVVRIDYYPMNRTMTFDGGYVGAPGSSLTEAAGKNIAARIPVPTRQGYTFAGWTPEAPSAMPSIDTSYTASWTGRDDTAYQVVYLLQNIGSDTYTVADTESYRGVTGSTASMTNPTRSYEGFTFNNSVPGTVLEAPIAGNGSTVLKLYYSRNSYAMSIQYNGSGAQDTVRQVPYGATTELYLGIPTRQGHTFTGWSPAITIMPAEPVEFTAQWTLNYSTVTFNSSGGSAVNDQNVGYGFQANEPNQPTKDDLVFGGWYADSDLTRLYDFTAQVTEDLTLYAKWLRSYTVSFDSMGGSEVADQAVNEGDRAIAPVAPTLEGFVFSGWYIDSDLTSVFDFETETVSNSFTLYANWIVAPKNSYTVSFNSNGGTAVADLTVEEGAIAAVPVAPTLSGHTHEGWYRDSGLTNRFSFSTTPITDNLLLYAKWTINTYTVSFNSNGGSAVGSQTVNYDDNAAAPMTPTRNGHRFNGWYSDAGLNTAYSFTTQVRANLTLYAKWTAVYTVSFDVDGGSPVADQTVDNGDHAAAPAAPTKDGYTFNGWYSDAEFQEAYLFTERPVIAGLTLYAKWTFNSYTVSFDSNGAPAVQSQEVVPGQSASAPVTPKWPGYRFDGWYSDANLTLAYDFMSSVTADITLYAKWTMTSWMQVGDGSRAGVGRHSNTVIDSQGNPYIAYIMNNNEVYVMKYENDEWQTIGDPATLEKGWSNSVQVSLAIDSTDTLYVSYNANLAGSTNLIVRKYSEGAWESVGNGIAIGFEQSITFDSDDTPYMVYVHSPSGGSRTIVVVRYRNNTWENVNSFTSSDPNNFTILLDPDNTLYVFYTYYSINNPIQTQVVKYEGANFTRTFIGGSQIPISGFRNASFALDPDGVPYIAYTVGSELKVVRYTGSAWEPLNASGSLVNPHGGITNISIAFDSNGIPHVAYLDAAHNDRVTVMRYENMSWSLVEYAGVSADNAMWARLSIDKDDNLLVSYIVGDFLNSKVFVMKYDPDLH